ncbi:3-hydroxyacyl-CoA dehydrogenase NAD-binding domain-containing protein [Roseicyclus persicicus]|uniref:3-hydroxyacyl-CoA dehydrogenase n=1 Tax=Roseicyclus persicicus TaxID=2650661 RepID=A0A7X6GZ62_9RHOB|nr:3-hydroxyacyl-CoA dehydrogenase NAD-binding domain-containing protein [Roseibacterium persicicum]NKX43807.1 3-hydroxyacyl-CoA dehydrogenase [Roseibacterium persicicum]
MAEFVRTGVEGRIGLIALDNPPVNAAGAALRAGLVAALDRLAADPAVEVIALYGEGRSFIAGADIREFGRPSAGPWLPEICNRLESCEKPVVAVLHGAALGGGLEVAIAAHARVAVAGVTLGFPEVTLGILPGAGGTQRAPRLIGVAAALDLITTGRRIGAEEALALGLVDQVTQGDPRAVALAAAGQVLAGRLPTRRTGDIHITPDPEAIEKTAEALKHSQPHLFSPHRCVEAVATAALPLPEGLAEERRLFRLCMDSPQRAGLIHAFFAERAVAKIREATATPRPVGQIGVVGAGTMGSGIATACLLAGYPVVLVEKSPEALARGSAAIARNLDGAVSRGKLRPEARAALSLDTATAAAALSGCDLVIEAVFEDMSVKQAVLSEIELACPGALIATNTSYLDLNEMAQGLDAPENFLGLHFFSPAHVMRLVEVVVAAETQPEVVATGFALARRLGKIAVRAGVCDGFIGNRIMSAYRKAADLMALDGTPIAAIDAAVRGYGFAMGPFEMGDLAGLDIGWAARKRQAATRDPAARYHGALADRLCEAGWFGRKTGRGWYDHSGDGPVPNPEIPRLLREIQAAEGITPRPLDAPDIVARYETAMIMEAARVVEEGIALRPIDVDAVFLFGYGFPRWKGGPLHQADAIGAAEICARIERHALDNPRFWQVPDILRRMARAGGRFADLNRED